MGFPVYDFRADVRNVLVTPQIRSRFLRMEPGQKASRHSHDLGHEIFLILEGRVEFEIDGEVRELGPGEMCVALKDQCHSVRVVGDEPMTMYLSVTPHVQPTHTGRTDSGERLPHRFSPSRSYDVEIDPTVPVGALVDRQVRAAQEAAEAAQGCRRVHEEAAGRLKRAVDAGDESGAAEARKQMWESIYALFEQVYALADVWNELAPRVTEANSR